MRMNQKQGFFTALGGKVRFVRGNYNITCDAVWLAAFAAGDAARFRAPEILDAGIGTGGAALCLLEHCPGARIAGIDISDQMLAECARNAALNGRDIDLIRGDIIKWKTNRTFDAVMTNPPYFKGTPRIISGSGAAAQATGESHAHHNADLCEWTRACLKRVRPKGYFFAIADAAALSEIVAALHAGGGRGINILPLFGSGKTAAERVLISARQGVRTGARISAGFSMNDEEILNGGTIASLRSRPGD
jgi:tRNA1(Val) A37 N6-methylase TrmN6